MHVNMVYFRPDGDRKDIPLQGSEILIGRAEDCNLRIPLGAVSRQHARIIITDNQVHVEDLRSANGTYVNGRKISRPTAINAGDQLAIGQATFVIQVNGKPAKLKAPTGPAPGLVNNAAAQPAQNFDNVLEDSGGVDVVEAEEAESVSEAEAVDGQYSEDQDSENIFGQDGDQEQDAAMDVELEAAEDVAVEAEAESVVGDEEAVVAEEADYGESVDVDVIAEDGSEVLDEEAVVAEEAESVIEDQDAVVMEDEEAVPGDEIAVDLEAIESVNEGAGSSSVEDILLDLENAEQQEKGH